MAVWVVIVCAGPSAKDEWADVLQGPKPSAVVAVNRAIQLTAGLQTAWAIVDLKAASERCSPAVPQGLLLTTQGALQGVRGEESHPGQCSRQMEPVAVDAVCAWPRRCNHGRWTCYTTALAFVWAADHCRHQGGGLVTFVGCDMAGAADWTGEEAEARHQTRWDRERGIVGDLATQARGKGVIVEGLPDDL